MVRRSAQVGTPSARPGRVARRLPAAVKERRDPTHIFVHRPRRQPVSGVVAALVVRRWPRLGSPHLGPAGHRAGVSPTTPPRPAAAGRRRPPAHRRVVAVVTAAGALAVGAGCVGVLLLMIRSNTGFARLDLRFAEFGARHASGTTTSVLRTISLLGGTTGIILVAFVVAVVECVPVAVTGRVRLPGDGRRRPVRHLQPRQVARRSRPADHRPAHRLRRHVVPVRPRHRGGGDVRRVRAADRARPIRAARQGLLGGAAGRSPSPSRRRGSSSACTGSPTSSAASSSAGPGSRSARSCSVAAGCTSGPRSRPPSRSPSRHRRLRRTRRTADLTASSVRDPCLDMAAADTLRGRVDRADDGRSRRRVPARRPAAALRRRHVRHDLGRDRPRVLGRRRHRRRSLHDAARGASTATTTRSSASTTSAPCTRERVRGRARRPPRVAAAGSEFPPSVIRAIDPDAPVPPRVRELPPIRPARRGALRHHRRRRPRRARRPDGAQRRTTRGPTRCCSSATRCTPTSPPTRSSTDSARAGTIPSSEVADEIQNFEEYTWLYHEAWTPPAVRWLLSTVPTGMLLDDHDLRDDWNTSLSWRREVTAQPWWHDRVDRRLRLVLGVPAPRQPQPRPARRRRGVRPDASRSPTTTSGPATSTTSRGGPTSTPRRSAAATTATSAAPAAASASSPSTAAAPASSIRTTAGWSTPPSGPGCASTSIGVDHPFDHLVLASTLPWLMLPGVHHLEGWDEAISEGAWGRPGKWLGERVRQVLDLEHWAAFRQSFDETVDLLARRRRARRRRRRPCSCSAATSTATTPPPPS